VGGAGDLWEPDGLEHVKVLEPFLQHDGERWWIKIEMEMEMETEQQKPHEDLRAADQRGGVSSAVYSLVCSCGLFRF
jgi:hypothetical protein